MVNCLQRETVRTQKGLNFVPGTQPLLIIFVIITNKEIILIKGYMLLSQIVVQEKDISLNICRPAVSFAVV